MSECCHCDAILNFEEGAVILCRQCAEAQEAQLAVEKSWRKQAEDRIQDLKAARDRRRALLDKAEAELAELLDEAFRGQAYLIKEGDMMGWWDSQALSSVQYWGDRLVELGTWERHPKGFGRRWFYRPKQVGEGHEHGHTVVR